MGMNLAKQSFSTEPEYLIAGTAIGITTGVKEAAVDLVKGAPVLIDSNGKAAKIVANSGVDTTGIYGIVADDAKSGEDAVIYLTGEFFADALVLETGVAIADLEIPFRNIGIFLKGADVNP